MQCSRNQTVIVGTQVLVFSYWIVFALNAEKGDTRKVPPLSDLIFFVVSTC